MKQRSDQDQWNKEQIEIHLKSAVDTLTPDIFEKLDLSVPQENEEAVKERQETKKGGAILFLSQMRGAALGAAASLCLLMTGGGVWYYQYENRQIDSVIGIDVNPSVELSINRRERVLKAEALNEDGNQILSDMELKGVDLNVAVNAVVGSMVTHGYLDDLDNAILVTVSNDSMTRASALRSSVVGNIEKTLEENQVQAVVYDQQAVENGYEGYGVAVCHNDGGAGRMDRERLPGFCGRNGGKQGNGDICRIGNGDLGTGNAGSRVTRTDPDIGRGREGVCDRRSECDCGPISVRRKSGRGSGGDRLC